MVKTAREPRQATATPARLNSNGRWQDVCIRNISSRGMMIEAQNPPARGHYLEVRRGAHVIVGRVVWSTGYWVGVVTQDELEVAAVLADAKVPARAVKRSELVERRRAPRHDDRHERSRTVGRAIEYGSFLALGAAAAMLAMDVAGAALREPLRQAQSAMTGQPDGEPAPAALIEIRKPLN
jgi:hypothetical protein